MHIQRKVAVERLKLIGLLPPIVQGQMCSFMERNEEIQKALSHAHIRRDVEKHEDSAPEEMATLRDLIESIQNVMKEVAEFVIFEENNEKTRQMFVDECDEYLNDLQIDRIIEDYYIVCDEHNNTSETIADHQFIASICIKPSKTNKYISIDMMIKPMGITLEDMKTTVAPDDEWQWHTIEDKEN